MRQHAQPLQSPASSLVTSGAVPGQLHLLKVTFRKAISLSARALASWGEFVTVPKGARAASACHRRVCLACTADPGG